jgi:hypothetical protein
MVKKWVKLPFILGVVAVLIIVSGCLSGMDTSRNDTTNLGSLNFTKYVGVNGVNTFLIMGTAQNIGDLPIQRVRLRIDYEDANHTPLASRTYDETVLIRPNETWDFNIPFTDPVVPQIYYYYITPLRVDFVK